MRPQYPQTWVQNFHPIKIVPSTTRSHTPPITSTGPPGNSPGRCSANHHASSRAHQVHVRCPATRPPPVRWLHCEKQVVPPFCGTQLAEICGVDRPRYEGDRGAPRLSVPRPALRRSLRRITPPRRRGAAGGILQRSSSSLARAGQVITHMHSASASIAAGSVK